MQTTIPSVRKTEEESNEDTTPSVTKPEEPKIPEENKEILDQVDPKSFGLGIAFTDAIFVLSKVALGSHRLGIAGADRTSDLIANRSEIFQIPSKQNHRHFALWGAPLALHARCKGDVLFPHLKNQGLGGIIGLDYFGSNRQVLGTRIGPHLPKGSWIEQDLRKAKMHQELATLYRSWKVGMILEIDGFSAIPFIGFD